MHLKVISLFFLFFLSAFIYGQNKDALENEWRLNIGFENMGTLAFNDR